MKKTETRYVVERRVFHDACMSPKHRDVWIAESFTRGSLKAARLDLKEARRGNVSKFRIVRVTTTREVVR